MAPDDHSGAKPAGPVVLRIKLRYDDLDAMVQKFAPNVGKSGLFLPTKSIQPIGTEVKFELRLTNDTPVLVGLGRVKHVRPPDPANPKAAFGMAIELLRVSREGREVIIRMIERRRALGLVDVAIPLPEDAEAARRGEVVDSQPRAETSAVVRDAMAQLASAPTPEPLLGARPASGPIAVAKEPSGGTATEPPRRPSAPLLTAPRTSSGAVPVAPLAPEKSRPRRPRVQDLIDKAAELSAPIIAALPTPELDMHVDVESVLTRARALAGGDLEVELAALREAAAAPIEISIEAASAELARQLGGKAIAKRERSGSARWAPPPAVAELRAKLPDVVEAPAATTPEWAAKTRAETEAAPSATIAAAVEAAIEAGSAGAAVVEPVADAPIETTIEATSEPPIETSSDNEPTPMFARDDYDDAYAPNATTTTAVDDPLDPKTDKPRRFLSASELGTDPSTTPLMIDDDADVQSFERALEAARVHTGVSKVAPPPRHDLDDEDDDDPAGDYAQGDRTQIGGVAAYAQLASIPDELAAQLDQQLAEAEAEAERDVADGIAGEPAYGEPGDDEEAEEISDLDVLAEADEDDADLLAGSTNHDTLAPPVAEVVAPPAYDEPVDDFAARLDLGDDDEPPPSDDFDRDAAREFDDELSPARYDSAPPVRPDSAPPAAYAEPRRPVLPAQHVEPARVPRYRRPSSEFPDPPSSSYTFAENYPQAGLQLGPDVGAEDFDEPHAYAPAPERAKRPTGPDPRLLRYGRATTAGSEDLEDALAALDVDLDDIANLDQRRPRRPTPSSSTGPRPLPGLPMERPSGQTGSHPVVKSPTASNPVVRSQTGQARITKPPPIPAAARKSPTQQVPIHPPSKRATSEDGGVIIDFDDDE